MTGTQKVIAVAVGIGAGFAIRKVIRDIRAQAFPGEVALVTGGTHGPGLALARQLVNEGCKLVICGADDSELNSARLALEEQGADVLAVRCDLTRREEVRGLIQQAEQHFGTIDILMNCSAVINGRVENLELESLEHSMAEVFWATVFTSLELLPSFMSRKKGRMIHVVPAAGGGASLRCARRATAGFSDELREELAPHGIEVTTITSARSAREVIAAVVANHGQTGRVMSRLQNFNPGAVADLLGAVSYLVLPSRRKGKWSKARAAIQIARSPLVSKLLELARQAGQKTKAPAAAHS